MTRPTPTVSHRQAVVRKLATCPPDWEPPAEHHTIARARAVKDDVAVFAHGHLLRVLVARWLGLPAGAGQHFLLDTGTVNVLDYYRGIPALKTWNAPLVGEMSPIVERASEAMTEPVIGMVATSSRVKGTTQ